jgi:outer membrane protein TolC
MLAFIDRGAGPTAPIVAVLVAGWSLAALAEPLTLADAQRLAVERDAGREALASEAEALRDMAIASGQLPDPQGRVGAVNLPTDSFALDQEPMTMLEVGVMQRFPAGDSRALSRHLLEQRAAVTDADTLDRTLATRLAVARLWHELDYQENVLGLLDRERDWVDTLLTGIGAAYAAGEGGQGMLLDARLAALDVEERRIGTERDREAAQAELARWIGSVAYGERVAVDVDSPRLPPLAALRERLDQHPRLLVLERERDTAATEVELSGERYKPEFGFDLSYGFRQGRSEDGSGWPDMLTAMITFDVPLFTRDRQDRESSAARARARAADARRTDALRALQAQLEAAHARATRLQTLIDLYEQRIRGLAEVSAKSALSGYRESDGPLADVVAAERRVIDVRERLARLRRDHAQALAEIDYLTGDAP